MPNGETLQAEVLRLRRRVLDLEAQVGLDALTGVLNRAAGQRALNRMERRAVRHKTYLAALFLDVDNFKDINDTFGHAVGDVVLRSVAETLQRYMRATDAVIRWGGEEFLILTENALDGALILAERLCQGIRRNVFAGGQSVTVSIGVAEGGHEGGWENMVELADMAMYRAKDGGRDRVEAGGISDEEARRWTQD